MAKRKVSFFSKYVLKSFFYIDFSIVSACVSFSLIFFDRFQQKRELGIFAIVGLILDYIYKWRQANKLKKVSITLNNSVIEICEGDIFKQEGFKIIAFNEYFDTQVNDEIISSKTLNGKYIKNYVKNMKILDRNIKYVLKEKIVGKCSTRKKGKRDIYKLGTIFKHNDFFLVAFSHFDEFNRAYLSMTDYVSCLLEMWSEIDRYYNGKNIVLPILGSGITRFRNKNLSEQELLEILLWSFKLSNVKLTVPAKIRIVVKADIIDKINLYKIQQEFN